MSPKPARSPYLDALRALAVLLVLGRHLFRIPAEPTWLRGTALVLQRGGWCGVDLFFVLSGFLVSGLLFAEYRRHGDVRPGLFLLRRGLKIYPAFYVFLGITALHEWETGLRAGPLLAEALFVQNYFAGLWEHTWSLAVEEHFYLLLALGVALAARRGARGLALLQPVLLSVAVATVALRTALALGRLDAAPRLLVMTHTRLDAFAIGSLLAWAFHFHRARLDALLQGRRAALLAAGAACFVPAFVLELTASRYLVTAGFTVLSLGSAAFVAVAATTGCEPGRIARLLAIVGARSYSIYLWHLPVRDWLMPWWVEATGFASVSLITLLAYLALSIGLGMLMARVVELPVLSLRDRLFPARDGGAREGDPAPRHRPAQPWSSGGH